MKYFFVFCLADKHSANKVTIKYKWKFNGKDLPLNGSIVWGSQYTLVFIDAKVHCYFFYALCGRRKNGIP